jgi:hypothetical protein
VGGGIYWLVSISVVEAYPPDMHASSWEPPHLLSLIMTAVHRDDNSDTGIGYPLDIRPDGDGYGYDFLSMSVICIRLKPRWIQVQVFFPARE